jgi:hypothetical protein
MSPPSRHPRSLRGALALLALFALVACLAALGSTACTAESRSEAIDPRTLPEDIRPDYAVFAQRCSKCHSLSRPLNSGITDDDYWAMYVARMRRQPESGISLEDSKVVLRFLHYYSLQQLAKKEHPPSAAGASPAMDGGAR